VRNVTKTVENDASARDWPFLAGEQFARLADADNGRDSKITSDKRNAKEVKMDDAKKPLAFKVAIKSTLAECERLFSRMIDPLESEAVDSVASPELEQLDRVASPESEEVESAAAPREPSDAESTLCDLRFVTAAVENET
jgi:hypothetical protein